MENVNNNGKGKLAITVVAVLATFLLMAFLVRQMVKVVQAPPVATDRAAARAKDNTDIRGAGAEALKSWGYVDAPKGIVRVPIDEAVKLTVQGYKNPIEFHSNLVARVEKATAKPPEKKSEYE
jgi:hypothetical protein